MSGLTLHDYELDDACYKVRLLLGALGLNYAKVAVDVHPGREQLSPIKCPRTIDFDPELPRHPTGKLYKRLIRDRYWGKRESRIV